MKRILILFSIYMTFSIGFSQTYYLNVNLKDGTKVTYQVSDVSKIDFGEITSLEDAEKLTRIVKSFKLMQNYPNPFNPSTTIQYEIPKAGKVEVQIFDIGGQLIKNIYSETQKAGSQKVVWNGQNNSGARVASGLYIYTVKFENSVFSKKMILLK